MCTVFGLKDAEQDYLVKNQAKLGLCDQITDKNRDNEGIEIATSAYKVISLDISIRDRIEGKFILHQI